ncbi:Glycine receptor subunit beta-type 4 [Halotydeus destructor]|nr:Glycine receptor subunit beta-type 4 [Halotydeus destructor]
MFVVKVANIHLICTILAISYTSAQDLPTDGANGPILVDIYLFIDRIQNINLLDMEFEMEYYIILGWDVSMATCGIYLAGLQGLGLGNVNKSWELKDNEIVVSDPQYDKVFWRPDTYGDVVKEETDPSIVSPTRKMTLTKSTHRKTGVPACRMNYIAKTLSRVGCQMTFQEFPVDVQECPVAFQSLLYDSEVVLYRWGTQEDPIQVDKDFALAQHDFSFTKTTDTIDNHSLVNCTFIFSRRVGGALVNVYWSSAVVVILSWLCFFMAVESINSRVNLSVTCMLALVTQFSANRAALPQVSYVTRSDIWMIACMVFIFVTLLEFTIVKNIIGSVEIRNLEYEDKMKRRVLRQKEKLKSTAELTTVSHVTQVKQAPELRQRFRVTRDFYLSPLAPRIFPAISLYDKHSASPYVYHIDGSTPTPRLQRHIPEYHMRTVVSHVTKQRSRTKLLEQRKLKLVERAKRKVHHFEKRFRIYFLLAFLIFTLFYWLYVYDLV